MRESPTLAAIIYYLELRSIPYFRVHPIKPASVKVGGVWQTRFTKVRASQKGAPDLFVWPGEGRGVAIETKRTEGKQSPEQKAWQVKLEKYGVTYRLARDAEEEIRWLERWRGGEINPLIFAPTTQGNSGSRL